MNSISKEQRVSSGRDRLSELPDEILVHILSFLPIVDAVRTVLIRRFGDLWTSLPSLEFYESEFCQGLVWPDWTDSDISNYDQYNSRFANFVRNVLIVHKKTPIDKFKLNFYDVGEYGAVHEILTWLRVAVDRQVKELIVQLVIVDIQSTVQNDGSILPMRVFTSQFLVTLDLEYCQIDELRQVHLPSLIKLSLTMVEVSNETFNKIVLGSPSLQELHLHHVYSLTELRFTAPNINKLMLTSYNGLLECPNLKTLDIYSKSRDCMQVVDVSSTREVNIKSCCIIHVFYEYMNKFCDAEVFKYSDRKFEMSIFKKQDFPQTRWKRLHIESLLLGDQLLGICRVLRSSPHLEELVVYYDSHHVSGRKHYTNALSPELPSCLMHQLKTVDIRGYTIPCPSLLQLVEFLLKNSVTLEKMVILPLPCKKKFAASNELKFVKQLLNFPRASSNARVTYVSEVY